MNFRNSAVVKPRLLLLVCLIGVPLLAQQKAAVSLAGVVVNYSSAEPMKGATVSLTPIAAVAGQKTVTIVTGNDGAFLFPDVQAGEYRLTAAFAGFLRAEFGQRTPNGRGIPIEIESGKQVPRITLKLAATGVLSGRVLDVDGNPGSGVTVKAFRPDYFDDQPGWSEIRSTRTNSNGEYRLDDLPPATYRIGTAVRQLSNQLASPPKYFPNADDLSSAAEVVLTSGAELGNLNLRLSQVSNRKIRGLVLEQSSGQPVSTDLALIPRSTDSGLNEVVFESRADGRFEVDGVLPGAYLLVATKDFGDTHCFGRLSIDVSDSDINVDKFILVPGAEFRGFVETETRLPNTSDVRQLRLNLIPQAPMSSRDLPPLLFSALPDGSLSMRGIPLGDYRVSVSGRPDNTYVKSILIDSIDVRLHSLHVDSASRGSIHVILGANPANVEGTVTDAAGHTAVNFIVSLIPDEPRRFEFDLYQGTTTDQAGKFAFSEVPPGSYKLFAWEDVDYDEWRSPEFIRKFEDRGKPVQLREGSRSVVDVKASPPAIR